LGNGAPKFILLHEGNTKIKPVPGLFEHIIDLNQPGSAMAVEIMSALKQICGDGWEKVVIEHLPPVSPAKPLERTLQKQTDAPGSSKVSDQAAPPREEPVLCTSVSAGAKMDVPGDPHVSSKQVYSSVQALSAPIHLAKADPQQEPEESTAQASRSLTGAQPAVTSVNDFTISGSATLPPEMIPEDILLAFDESRIRSRKFVLMCVVALLGVIGGAGYLFREHPRLGSLYQSVAPAPKLPEQMPVPVDKAKASTSIQAVQKPVSSASRTDVVTPAPLPTFVSEKGRDSAFSSHKPGWERYVDSQRDIRIFRQGGRIKALQVLAAPGQVISEGFFKTALKEMTGSVDVAPGSRRRQQGFLTERSRVGQHADLLIYRTIQSKAIFAFVVSID
jgi:hypothetical protein